jgi:hypothetical protein
MTFNADTYAHDLLRVCGATNVFAERERLYPLKADLGQADAYPEDDLRAQGRDTRYPRVTMEEVEAAQPDMILLPNYFSRWFTVDLAWNAPGARHEHPSALNVPVRVGDAV